MLSDNRHSAMWSWLSLTAILIIFWWLAGSSYDQMVLVNTVMLGVLASCIAIPLGCILASSSSRKSVLGRLTLLLVLAFALVPIVFQVSCWDAAFGKLGWLTAQWTGTNQPIVSSWVATIWIHAASLAPQIAILFLAAILGGKKVHEEQALIDSSKSQTFWHVILPRYIPVIALGVCWSVISCSREIAVTDIYQVGTVAEQVYLGFSLGQFDSVLGTGPAREMATDNTLSIGLQVSTVCWLVFSAVLVFSSLIKRERLAENFRPVLRQNSQSPLSIIANLLTLMVLFGVPTWNLLARSSFHVARINEKPVGGHSLENFTTAIRRALTDYLPQTYWSIVIATGCLVATMILAISLGWLVRRSAVARIPTIVLVSICFALPGPIIGTSLLQLYTSIDSDLIDFLFNRTVAPAIFANVIFCLPIATVLMWFVLSTAPMDSEEHLLTEGAGQWKAFWQFGVMANLVPITGIAILCFVLAYGELSATQMVLPPGVETVSRLTLGLMHAGVNKMTAALTIVNVVAILAVSLLGWQLVSLKWRHRKQQ